MATRDVVLQNLVINGTRIVARPPYTIDGGGGGGGSAGQVFGPFTPNWSGLGAAEALAQGTGIAFWADLSACTEVRLVGLSFAGAAGSGFASLARITDLVTYATWDRLGETGLSLSTPDPVDSGWESLGSADLSGVGSYTFVGYGGDGSKNPSLEVTVYLR